MGPWLHTVTSAKSQQNSQSVSKMWVKSHFFVQTFQWLPITLWVKSLHPHDGLWGSLHSQQPLLLFWLWFLLLWDSDLSAGIPTRFPLRAFVPLFFYLECSSIPHLRQVLNHLSPYHWGLPWTPNLQSHFPHLHCAPPSSPSVLFLNSTLS